MVTVTLGTGETGALGIMQLCSLVLVRSTLCYNSTWLKVFLGD